MNPGMEDMIQGLISKVGISKEQAEKVIEFIKENVDLIFIAAVVIVVGFSAVPAALHWRQKRSAGAVTKP